MRVGSYAAAVAATLARGSLDVSLAANERVVGLARDPERAVDGERTFFEAARRSGEEARAVRASSNRGPDSVFLARVGGLALSQAFLLAESGLATGERLSRELSLGAAGSAGRPRRAGLPRALLIGAVASDLYLGYAALRGRARLRPDLVGAEDWDLEHRRGAARVLDAAASLGGALIKAGQFASTRPDLLPGAYVERLSVLQDHVPPLPWPAVERALIAETGRPLREVFAAVEPKPIAAASLAQVHRARLLDGRSVALKVRYPGIEELVEADLGALESAFDRLSALEPHIQLRPIADYLRWTLPLELDFLREAEALRELKVTLRDRESEVAIPGIVEEFSSRGLLVMDLMEGIKITDREALVSAGIDPRAVAELLNDVYADQIYARRYLHADPHPGNILVQRNGDRPRLVLLDHGLTLALEPEFVNPLAKMVRAIPEGDFESVTAALAEAGLRLGEEADLGALLQLVGVLFGKEERAEEGEDEALDLGSFGTSLGSGIGNLPPKLILVGRAIGLLDGITRQLDPSLDALEIVSRYARA